MLVALMILTGCVGQTPLEQLKSEALINGDWSKVERRERSIAMRQLRSDVPQCPADLVHFCEVRFGSERCECVAADALPGIFSYR